MPAKEMPVLFTRHTPIANLAGGLLLATIIPIASAETPNREALANCALIKDNTRRLDCYDALTPPEPRVERARPRSLSRSTRTN